MKVAFAFLEDRIAPVFDTARWIHIAAAEGMRLVLETQESLPEGLPLHRARRLVELEVGILVCGAISNPMLRMLAANGITVMPFVAGELREVIQAWLKGELQGDAYLMPGCRGGVRRHGLGPIHQEGGIMQGRGGRGGGQGAGSGQGGGQGAGAGRCRGQEGRGRVPVANTGPETVTVACLCPKCGHRENHEQGVPCTQKACPKCGTVMTRE